MQTSIQTNPITYWCSVWKSNYHAITHRSCCSSCAIVAEGHVTRPWSSNEGKTLSGRRLCERLSGGLSITQSKEADRFDMSESVSGWGHCAWSRTAGPPAQKTRMQLRMSTQTGAQSHGFLWQLQTNSPCMCWPHPSRREGETNTEKQKNRSKIESEMKARWRDVTCEFVTTYASLYAFPKGLSQEHQRNP